MAEPIPAQPKHHRVVFEPTITLGHLITTASLIAGLLLWGARLEGRVDQVDQARAFMEKQWEREQAATSARTTETLAEIKSGLRRIEDKLDHKADKPSAR